MLLAEASVQEPFLHSHTSLGRGISRGLPKLPDFCTSSVCELSHADANDDLMSCMACTSLF